MLNYRRLFGLFVAVAVMSCLHPALAFGDDFGAPTLAATTTGVDQTNASELGHGDFNGDGRQDIVLALQYGPVRDQEVPIQILLNNGNGSFAEAPASFFAGGVPGVVHPRQTIIEDFNRDGRDDIFIADHGYDAPPFPGNHSTLLLSRADGRMDNANANIPSFKNFTHSAAAGDIDGDGDLDLFYNNPETVVANKGPYFLLNDGNGVFTSTTRSTTLNGNSFLAAQLVDVNGDKFIDLVQAASGANAGSTGNFGFSSVRLGVGDGTFGTPNFSAFPPRPFGNSASLHDIQPLDFDNDGDLDFVATGAVVGAAAAQRFVQVLRNNGGAFADATSQMIPAGFNDPTSNNWIIYVHLNDVTGDCVPDLTPQDATQTVSMKGNPTGYGPPQSVQTVGSFAWEMLDMDDDGGADIVRTSVNHQYFLTPSTASRACNGLRSAVAPAARTVSPGSFATAFFSVTNGLSVAAHRCRLIQRVNGVETAFFYRATDPATNVAVGSPLQRFDIPAGATRSFVFAVSPLTQATNATVDIKVDCLNVRPAPSSANVNRFSVTGATGAAADIIPIAVTPSNDGVVRTHGPNGTQILAAAAVNLRDEETITVRPRYTGSEQVSLFVCETNAAGACTSVLTPTIDVVMAPNQPRTFTVLVEPRGTALPADFENRRIVLEFLGGGQVSRGQATVAVTTD
jgi:hypothetical protein